MSTPEEYLKELDAKIAELEKAQAEGDESRTTRLRLNSLRVFRQRFEKGV